MKGKSKVIPSWLKSTPFFQNSYCWHFAPQTPVGPDETSGYIIVGESLSRHANCLQSELERRDILLDRDTGDTSHSN